MREEKGEGGIENGNRIGWVRRREEVLEMREEEGV